jgi:hypothetical protein
MKIGREQIRCGNISASGNISGEAMRRWPTLSREQAAGRGLAYVQARRAGGSFYVHLKDRSVMNEAIDDNDCHCLVVEHGAMPQ